MDRDLALGGDRGEISGETVRRNKFPGSHRIPDDTGGERQIDTEFDEVGDGSFDSQGGQTVDWYHLVAGEMANAQTHAGKSGALACRDDEVEAVEEEVAEAGRPWST